MVGTEAPHEEDSGRFLQSELPGDAIARKSPNHFLRAIMGSSPLNEIAIAVPFCELP
jgi:hypothetical protein